MNIKKYLKSIKLHESTISMILGAIIIVIVGILLINYFSARRGETIPPVEIGDEQELPTKHIVAEGEDLWGISEKYYGTGYNWTDIVKENNLTDPNEIEKGQELTIPAVSPRVVRLSDTPTDTPVASISPTITEVAKEMESIQKTSHKVANGDSLWKIAEKYYDSGYNWVDIAKENGLKEPGNISEGQELVIPAVEPKTKTVEVIAATPEEPISSATYTIQSGDSLWNIAVRAYGDGYKWVEIAKENKLENPSVIHPGNQLLLPR